MRIALAQINPTVGDIAGNTELILRSIDAASAAGADLVVLPELAVFGYPPKDLLMRQDLVDRNVTAIEAIASRCVSLAAVVGYVQPDGSHSGKGVYNAAAFCRQGRRVAWYAKRLLPTYDVFDETRYFNPGQDCRTVRLPVTGGEVTVGLTICEDLWNDRQFEGRRVYGVDPIRETAAAGAELIVNVSGSPFAAGKQTERETIFAQQMRELRVSLVYVNQVGGHDELLFDGASLVLDAEGKVLARGRCFQEDLLVVDLRRPEADRVEAYPDRIHSVHDALVVGIRDYMRKCGFREAVVGLSGGVDSATTAALAVEALGADRVHGVAMPSRYSSAHSLEDATQLAENLGIEMRVIPIEPAHRALEGMLAPHFRGLPAGVAEENIQSRIRGNVLMALSNKFDWLLLTTGNKSELAVGYCTLYGDLSGGLAVLSDVPKTTVFELARMINASAGRPCIPTRTITKPPSAELRPDQCDEDSLPAYEVLDPLLERLVERDESVESIAARGFDRQTLERVARMVERSEHKRKQAPIGLKVTSRAFGTGRRMPIAARFH